MPNRIQLRRGNANEWTAANPLLAEGEIAVELDTGKFKIGDGVTYWTSLNYSSGLPGPQGPAGASGASGTSPTISVGTVSVSTVTTVVNVGDSTNAIFDFTFPSGPKGDTGTQINKVIDIPDVYTGGVGNPNLVAGAFLVYNSLASRWDTTNTPPDQNIDGGEF